VSVGVRRSRRSKDIATSAEGGGNGVVNERHKTGEPGVSSIGHEVLDRYRTDPPPAPRFAAMTGAAAAALAATLGVAAASESNDDKTQREGNCDHETDDHHERLRRRRDARTRRPG
jgi:hypothetical protein